MTKPTRGQRNHNPLNIRKGNDWQGEAPTPSDPAFEVFINDLYGLRAGFKVLKRYLTASPRCQNIRDIITRWAPPQDHNDTEAYIKTVSARSGVPSYERVVFADKLRLCQIVKAMCFVESCYEPSDRILSDAYDLAK